MQHQITWRRHFIILLIVTVFLTCAAFGAGTDTASAATRLKITPVSKTLKIGNKTTFKANQSVKWSIAGNKGKLKIVSKSPKKITVKGLKSGTVDIKAKAGKKSVKATLEVGKAPDKMILVATDSTVGVNLQIGVYLKSITPSSASSDVIYSSSDDEIATVSDTGMVKGVKAGKVTITATSKYDSKKTASVDIKVVDSLKATIKMTADLSDANKYPKGQAAKLWVPVSKTVENQSVAESLIQWKAPTASEAKITTDSAGNKSVYIMWDENVEPSERKATVSFHVKRLATGQPEDFERKEQGTVDTTKMAEYLKASSHTGSVTSGIVKETADKIVKDAKAETVYGKARAIYDWVCDNLSTDNKQDVVGKGDVQYTLKHTDEKYFGSADVCNAFVAMCRAEGIPARCTYGLRLKLIDNNPKFQYIQNCIAQFYLPGYGWTDADISSVLRIIGGHEKNYRGENAPFKDNWLTLKDRYWGASSEMWVNISSGEDITLSPKQDDTSISDAIVNPDGTLAYFAYPYAEFGGKYIRCYKDSNGNAPEIDYKYSFVVDKEECDCA